MASGTLDTLSIEINANAGKASESINGLVGSLRSFAKGVGTAVPALRELNRNLKELSKYGSIKLPSLTGVNGSAGAKATQQIKQQTKAISDQADVMKRISVTPYNPGQYYGTWKSRGPTTEDYLRNGGRDYSAEHARDLKEANRRFDEIMSRPNAQANMLMNTRRLNEKLWGGGKSTTDATAEFNRRFSEIMARPNAQENMLANTRRLNEQLWGAKTAQEAPKPAAPIVQSAQGATSGMDAASAGMKKAESAAGGLTQALKNTDRELKMKQKDGAAAKQGFDSAASGANNAASGAKNAADGAKTAGSNMKDAGNAGAAGAKKVGKFGEALSHIGRMAKTMILRTVLRSLIRAFSESWQAAYAFSNKMGGSFAKSVDAAKESLYTITTSVIQAFAPAFQAIVPVIVVVAQAIEYLSKLIQQLFAWLGMTSDLMGASASQINQHLGQTSSNASNAHKKMKGLLADWDELNIIQQQNDGGGSGGGGGGIKPGSMANLVKPEIGAILSVIVGEGLLAVGLILACTGHIGLGIGCIAIGAAAIAKPLFADWDKLPDGVKNTIITIVGIAGVSMLAIGLILACTCSLPLGIGMIVLGAAQLVAAVAVSWNDTTSGVKKTLTDIMVIAGASMLALGVILCCCQVWPLGIGMLIAGGASLATAVALNWDAVKDRVNAIITAIADWFVEKWNMISSAVANAWDTVKQWWETNIASKVRAAWDSVKTFFSTAWNNIKGWAQGAWDTVSNWWDTNVKDKVDAVWSAVSPYFEAVFGDPSTPGTVAYYASEAWGHAKQWWETNVMENIQREGIWGGVKGFFKGIFVGSDGNGGIVGFHKKAWKLASDWWTNDVTRFAQDKWHSFSTFFKNLFGDSSHAGSIAHFASTAWSTVKDWWQTNVTEKVEAEGIWGGVKGFFKGIFVGDDGNGGIVGFHKQAWNLVKEWWDNGVSEKVSGAWDSVKAYFEGLWGATGLSDTFSSLWESISQLWGDIVTKVNDAWSSVATWFDTNVTSPIKKAFEDAINWIIDKINFVIGGMNSIGSFTIPGWGFDTPWGQHWGWSDTTVTLWDIPTIAPFEFASGAYDIPKGDLFIANEAGAELVGNMNGKTTVANQGQIVEGIQRGVADANRSQNELLIQQNELLRAILAKTGFSPEPSAEWGRFNQRSTELWNMASGR